MIVTLYRTIPDTFTDYRSNQVCKYMKLEIVNSSDWIDSRIFIYGSPYLPNDFALVTYGKANKLDIVIFIEVPSVKLIHPTKAIELLKKYTAIYIRKNL